MNEPTIKEILAAITERRRSILPIRVYNVLNALDTDLDGIKQAFAWVVHLMEGRCIVFSGGIGTGKTISAAFMACYWTWLSCKPLFDGLKEDPTLYSMPINKDDILKVAIAEGMKRNRFRWVDAAEILQLEWQRYDSEYGNKEEWGAGLLVVDDLGREYLKEGSEYAPRRWDEFFNLRYQSNLSTIITTNLTPGEFEARYGERNMSRLREWGIWLEIAQEDLRT